MLPRTPEPELMDTPAQVAAYVAADFAVPHQAVVERFAATFPDFARGRVLDLGCGAADVTARFALAYPDVAVVGLDAGPVMLAAARERLAADGLADRVTLVERRLPDRDLPALGPFDAVISNSLLHHLAAPAALWDAVRAAAAPGAPVLVQDLLRPSSSAEVDALVERHAADEDPVLQEDFRHSLHAAYTPEEVVVQLAAAGLDALGVEIVSDRHLVVAGRVPPA